MTNPFFVNSPFSIQTSKNINTVSDENVNREGYSTTNQKLSQKPIKNIWKTKSNLIDNFFLENKHDLSPPIPNKHKQQSKVVSLPTSKNRKYLFQNPTNKEYSSSILQSIQPMRIEKKNSKKKTRLKKQKKKKKKQISKESTQKKLSKY
ncbi:hypothetical protein M0813_24718 [Anaeramoeba flamelloides]|uniref:Uncharacterized protein n=1 Tax=Anaeramoeba flamelloides TaxID=1746091 RepID=A0ABQ8Y4P6_9EUKA|nr:hypothetical protein M0813_24718 [Anaeramoeba flamelloides]